MKLFNFTKKRYRKGVFMVTYRFNKGKLEFLVQKRKLHWKGYEFPKGGIEKGESKLQTIRREIFEETGLKPKKIKNHHKKGKWLYEEQLKDRPGLIGQTWSLFSVEVENSKIKIDPHEHYDSKWMPYKKARSTLTWQDQKECLDIVYKYLTKKISN